MEQHLVRKAQKGDVKSFEILVRQYNRYVYNIALRMLGNPEDAKDASQEALVKAYQSIHTFRMDAAFSSWLYRITINTCKDELRKRRDSIIYFDDASDEGFSLLETIASATEIDPLIKLERKEVMAKINEAIGQLNVKYREVIILKDIMEESYESICEILSLPMGTVSSRLNRGRLLLRESLKGGVAHDM